MTIDNRSLDTRLNALDNVNADLDQTTRDINPNENVDTVLSSAVPYTTEGDFMQDETSILPDQTDPTFTGEKVDVAINLKKPLDIVKKIITRTSKDVVNDIDQPLAIPGKAIQKKGKFTVIPEAGQATTETVMKQMVTPDPKAEIDKLLYDPSSSLDFNNLGKSITDTYDLAKYDKMSYNDIIANIKKDGIYDEKFLDYVVNTNAQTIADPKQFAMLPYVARSIQDKNVELWQKYVAAKAIDPLSLETKDLAAQFSLGINMEGNFMKGAVGKRRDVARTFGILRQAYQESTISTKRTEMLDKVLESAGGLDNIDDLGNHYIALNSGMDRSFLAEKTLYSNVKDIWYATWINGLLSSPITHAKNIAGNALFGAWQTPERLVAATLGKGRSVLTGSKDYIQMNEVMDQAQAMATASKDAFRLAGKAFKTNMPTDPVTKLEISKIGRDDFNLNFGESMFGKGMSEAIKYAGNVITIPGRTLMAEDEFFKAIGYRSELAALARREGNRKYDELISTGVDVDKARTQSTNYMADLLTNPTDELHEAATKQARTVTFTAELEGRMAWLNKGINTEFLGVPMFKLYVPFVRTPANIVKETLSRTPAAFVLPSVRKAIAAGGIEADQALAKITLGSMAMYGMHEYALGGNLTGAGPTRYKDLETLKAVGWQPFSFTFNKSDVSDEDITMFSEVSNVSVGADKVYISYESLGPLASLLGMSATSAEYSMQDPDEEGLKFLAMNGALGLYDYMGNLDMLQGISDLHDTFSSDSTTNKRKLYDILSKVSQKAVEFGLGGSPIIMVDGKISTGTYSSLSATAERYLHPERSNLMREDTAIRDDVNPFYEGYWKALADIKSRSPRMSDALPPALDPLTGDEKTSGKGNFYETFNPFKTSDGKPIEGYATLLEYGVPVYVPAKSKDGVMLSGEQYNRWIEIATNDGALEKRIVKLGKLYKSIKGMDMSIAQKALNKEISDTYSIAWDRLIREDVDLQMAVQEVKDTQKETGIYTR
jgi:hypothetical protein